MSELALTLLRFGFLALLWMAVFLTLGVLRRDLKAPREARPAAVKPSNPVPPPVAQKPRGRRSMGSKLMITSGELAGTAVPLSNSTITIGRAPDSTIVLQDDYVSTHHARLTPSHQEWVLEDLGSTNGTWIDKTRITTPTRVRVGAAIRIGRTTLKIEK